MINNSTCYALSLLRGPMHVEKGSRNGAAIHVKGTPTSPVTPPPDEQPPLRTTSRLWSGPQWSDCRGARCLRTLSKVIDRPSDGEVLALHLGIAEPCLQMFMIELRTWCYTRPGADASSSPIDVSQRAVLCIYNFPLGRRRRAKPR